MLNKKYSKEVKQIFKDLNDPVITPKKLLLGILDYYKSNSNKEDELFSNYFDRLILDSYETIYSELSSLEEIKYEPLPMARSLSKATDSDLTLCMYQAGLELDMLGHLNPELNEIKVSHIVLAILKGCKNIREVLTKYNIDYLSLASEFKDIIKIYDKLNDMFKNPSNFKTDEFLKSLNDRNFCSSEEKEKFDLDKALDEAKDFVKRLTDSMDDDELESMGFPINEEESYKSDLDKNSPTPMLDKYARDMVAESEKFDPVIGRDTELSQLLEILGCKKKNNAILLGESGVGKTSVVELLAYRIHTSQVPKSFIEKKIYSLNLNSLVAGTKYRGQYEERLQKIIDEVINNPNIIVFIDEIHNLIGNGSSDGKGDAANILKPYLSKGLFQCIGSTTHREYRKYIEKDGALKRRFQNIIISEPEKEDTKIILRNIKNVYEEYHNVIFSKEIIDKCVDLSERYITDRFFPDKAIDILDLCGSLAHLENSVEETKRYLNTKTEIQVFKTNMKENIEKARLSYKVVFENEENGSTILDEDFNEGDSFMNESLEYLNKLNEAEKNLEKEEKSKPIKVDIKHVYEAIGKRSGIPVEKIGDSDLDKLRKINSILSKTVIGQETAIKEIVLSLQRNSLGLRDPKKPIASLLFVGPTGSGKTYLCKTLASEFFGSEKSLIKFDMSEFGEKHEITKLTGASASFVGYEDEPLFEQVRKNPYSVVLFDEIEKAAPEIFQIFLSILDEGYVTLSNGIKVDFKNTIIVFTGNIGTKDLQLFGNGVGFSGKSEGKKESIVNKAISKTFSPEFRNRISKTVIFNDLSNQDLIKICDLELKKVAERLGQKKIRLTVSKSLKEFLVSKCDLKFGARDLQRNITKYVEEEICTKLLETDINDLEKRTIEVNVKDNSVVVSI